MKGGYQQFMALAQLTAAALAAQQAKMTLLLQEEALLRARLADLDQATRARAAEIAGEADAALRAGADMRWHLWIEERRSTLQSQLALTLARREALRADMARAFGRNQVTELLRDEAVQHHVKAVEKKRENQT